MFILIILNKKYVGKMQIFTVQEAASFFVQNYDDNPMQRGK
jgi:hypothetical protein